MDWVPVDAERVRQVTIELLVSVGLPVDDAATVAVVQLEADLRGMHSHGVRAIPMYLARVEGGIINPRPDIRVETTGRAAVVVYGDAGPGQVVAVRAMQECIALARTHGFAVATARQSNHLGAVGYYARQAAAANLIGFATTNGNVMLPPPGAREPVVGNNPLAWAFPTGEEPPFCLDIATSVVAGGKIDLAAAEGDAIPAGWGVDAAGHLTTDAALAAAGGLALPLGAPATPYKGFGLALVLEALAGVLAGARFGRQHTVEVEMGPRPWDEGHFFLAFDPALLLPLAEFKRRMDALIRDVRAVPPGPDGQPARVPGEAGWRRAEQARRVGLRLPRSVYRRLAEQAARRGTPTRLPSEAVE
ncbi:MAG: Ldh family oxidoreductase [Chloroflexi bacterium]|nr:Ldh family oxidoreductase [Chloroflexota bacterium]